MEADPSRKNVDVAVLGAGPAGLAAALELARKGKRVVVFEREEAVGGLARTVEHDGFRFDIGGHRFFTRNAEVEQLWHSLLGDDLLVRPRQSRILYNGRFFDYPLRPWNTLRNLGALESFLILLSYLRSRILPTTPEASFEDWIVNRFGRRLYEIFFRAYTEKVWGIPCGSIRAEWAAQRIRGLSLRSAIFSMIFPATGKGRLRTLIDRFHYPRLGPGMMWERMTEEIRRCGGEVLLQADVRRLMFGSGRAAVVDVAVPEGAVRYAADHVISSLPLGSLSTIVDPSPEGVAAAAGFLRYRDFLTVAVIVDAEDVFSDNWLYINSPDVRVGRIQNFKNWSPEMVPDPRMTCLGLEYFCFRDDDLWSMEDDDLLVLAKRELATLGLVNPEVVKGGAVVRMPKAYPMYDEGYAAVVQGVREWLEKIPNLQVIGRNGMHRYNNMDHSMLTGILAARNVLGERHDLWSINSADDYCEN